MVTKAKGKTQGEQATGEDAGPVTLRVGPVDYELHLFSGFLESQGHECLGLIQFDVCRILISDKAPIRKRIATFWHELGHAIVSECFYRDSFPKLDEEDLCNMLGIGMSAIDADTLKQVHELLSRDTGSASIVLTES